MCCFHATHEIVRSERAKVRSGTGGQRSRVHGGCEVERTQTQVRLSKDRGGGDVGADDGNVL